MNLRWYRTARSLLDGSFVAPAMLDTTLNADPLYQHPAVGSVLAVPSLTAVTGAAVAAGTSLSGTTSGTGWVSDGDVVYTNNNGDYVEFTTASSCVFIQVYLTGVMTAGMNASVGDTGLTMATIRNGAVASIHLDGVQVALVDTFNAVKQWSVSFPTAGVHVVRVVHSGTFGVSVRPLGPVTQTVGTSVSPVVVADLTNSPTAAKWRVLATGASAYTLFKTPVTTGVEVTVATGLVAGGSPTTYTELGFTIEVPGTLVTNDEARFVTDQTMVALLEVDTSASHGASGGSYTSAVVDSTTFDPTSGQVVDDGTNTQWFCMRWVHNFPPATVTLEVSDNATTVGGQLQLSLDSTYSTTTVAPLSAVLPSGAAVGFAGLLSTPRGRYARWTVTFQTGLPVGTFVRDVLLYWTNPEVDPEFLDTVAAAQLGSRYWDGPSLGLLGTFGVMTADYVRAKDDVVASYVVQNAVDQVLAAYGAAQGLPQYTGEPPESYQIRVGGSFASRSRGGTIDHICRQAAELVQGQSPQTVTAPSYASVGGALYASVSGGGVTVAQTPGRAFSVTFPAPQADPLPPYPGLPGLSLTAAQSLISDFVTKKLRPVGSSITLNF